MDELNDYEKMIQGASQLAATVAAYYAALIESGIEKSLAKSLTVDYQDAIMRIITNKTNG